MPRDKTLSHRKVNAAIREEFLEKGYEGASIRSIGDRAGMTSAGLYRHYRDKDDMFDSIVSPLLQEIDDWTRKHEERKYQLVEAQEDRNMIFGETFVDLIKEVIIPRKEEFRLVLKGAKGSRYENFIHDFVEDNQGKLMEAIHYMKEKGYPAILLSEEELHMLLSAYLTAIFEPILHGYDEDKIEGYLDRINDFFMPGWMKIMGLTN